MTGPSWSTAARSRRCCARLRAAARHDAPQPCFEVSDLRIVTHRVIGGIPVNDDGGVAVRTKH